MRRLTKGDGAAPDRGTPALALVALAALMAIGLATWQLERLRTGLRIEAVEIDATPATLYRGPGGDGSLVVVAHGFAGSRQLMQAYSLTLARAGHTVLAYDLLGHGRNPVPMSGDVMSTDGTTALLVEELRRVIATGRDLAGVGAGTVLLGHSMSTDVVVRAARLEREAGRPVDAVVAVSMFSPAITASEPARLLVLSGQWEGRLRDAALAALRQVEPGASEGETARDGDVVRRAAVAPHVEHVGVLYSVMALRETLAWLDTDTGAGGDAAIVAAPGPWILLLLGAIVALFRPLSALLPASGPPAPTIGTKRFLLAVLVPSALAPLVATRLPTDFLPVLVADYLAVHLALYGLVQLVLLRPWRSPGRRTGSAAIVVPATLLLVAWGIGAFGVALDRYAASFLPVPERLPIIAALCAGTLPFMLGDAVVSGAGHGRAWRRVVARLGFVLSLGAAVVLRPAELGFLFIVLPVIVLFFVVHGLMGRWVARRGGALPAGIGLGLILAWAIGVSFPSFGEEPPPAPTQPRSGAVAL